MNHFAEQAWRCHLGILDRSAHSHNSDVEETIHLMHVRYTANLCAFIRTVWHHIDRTECGAPVQSPRCVILLH